MEQMTIKPFIYIFVIHYTYFANIVNSKILMW